MKGGVVVCKYVVSQTLGRAILSDGTQPCKDFERIPEKLKEGTSSLRTRVFVLSVVLALLAFQSTRCRFYPLPSFWGVKNTSSPSKRTPAACTRHLPGAPPLLLLPPFVEGRGTACGVRKQAPR